MPDRAELWPSAAARFSGWALSSDQLPAGVDIVFDKGRRYPAELGRPRPDVAVALGRPHAPRECGWSVDIDLSAMPRGQVVVQVVVRHGRWRRTTVATRTYDLRDDGFAGEVVSPADGVELTDNLLVVAGWAVFGASGPTRVEVEVDGRVVGCARLRLPDALAEALDPVRMGPFAGFQFIETIAPAPGQELTVAVLATATNGRVIRMAERRLRCEPLGLSEVDARRGATLRARTAASLPPDLGQTNSAGRRRLLVFTHQLSLGGGQLYLQELLRRMIPSLAACTLVAPSDGVLRADLEEMGVDVIVTGRAAPNLLETYEGQVRELSTFIRACACDVVLVNTLTELPAADAAARMGVPVIWTVHESYTIEAWLTVFYGRRAWHPYIADRLRHTLASATRVVFEAESTSALFASHVGTGQRMVIPYGIDTARIAEFAATFDKGDARRRHGIADEATVLLVVGQVEERKSQSALVEAFAAAASNHAESVLIMIGDVAGTYSDALHRQLEACGLGERIRLLPPTANILEWYALADVLVSASDIESLPRSMMEAMALGVPVLSAAVHGIPELIDDGSNGWLFAPRDMTALIDGIRAVVDMDGGTRRAAGEAARRRVLDRFDSSGYATAILTLVDRLASAASDHETTQPSRLLRAVDVLDRAAGSSSRLGSTPSRPMYQMSMRLQEFNQGAPYARDDIAAFIAEAARGLDPSTQVADIGAGDAPYRELFAHVEYLTVDWNQSMHGGSANSDIVASAESLPLADGSIDVVLLTEVLEHLPEPRIALAEIARILRPSGMLYLTVPFVWILHEMPHDYFRYTPSALRMLLEGAGFEGVSVVPRGDYFTTLAQLMAIVPTWMKADPDPSEGAEVRGRAADALARLSTAVAALSPLDDGGLLPLGFNVTGCRAASLPPGMVEPPSRSQ